MLFRLILTGPGPKDTSNGPPGWALIFLLPIALIARMILFCTGWHLFTPEDFRKLEKYPRTILVFSHSTRFDFLFLLLYRAAHPYGLYNLRTLVKPQVFKYAGYILKFLGCIPSTRIEDKTGGAVDRIVNELKSSPRSMFAISPKGTTSRNEWRTGYYHIAQKLEAPLIACGVDYELKRPYISENVDYKLPEPEVQNKLGIELGNIVPLYPECEIMPIRNHNSNQRTLFNYVHCLMLIECVILAILLL